MQAAPPYLLTISTEGSGTVSRNPSFDVYPANSVVTLTANPASNWVFSHWSGDLSASENPANMLMSWPRSVTAHFTALPNYTIATSVMGGGTLTLSPTGGTYVAGTTVTATATSSDGWVFIGWSGDASGSTNPLSITVQPVIEQSPGNIVTNSGSTVSFEITARGTAPLSYKMAVFR